MNDIDLKQVLQMIHDLEFEVRASLDHGWPKTHCDFERAIELSNDLYMALIQADAETWERRAKEAEGEKKST